jgi:hypothetical protein
VPANRIAVTEYWSAAFSWSFLKDKRNTLFFSPSRVCNLHQRQACKYGSACKNVHICREFWMEVVQPYPSPERDMMLQFKTMKTMGPEAHQYPGMTAAPEPMLALPKMKRISRALAIVDPTSRQEVQVVKPVPLSIPKVTEQPASDEAFVGSGLDVELDLLSHKVEGASNPTADPLCLGIQHLDLMALNMDGFQHIFALPLDLEAELHQGLPEVISTKPASTIAKAAPGDSPINLSFNRPGSPSNSSGTDTSYGEDSEDDLQKRSSKALYNAFWGSSVLAPPTVFSTATPGAY